jgi:monoterpene epsilon-lactone hydrolase
MPSPQFDRLVGLLRERRRPDDFLMSLPIGALRRGLEASAFPVPKDVDLTSVAVLGRSADWVVAAGACNEHVVLYLHGGGYVMGSPATHRKLAGDISRAAGVPVLVPDYRLAPEHPHPSGFNDAIDSYRWLLDRVGDAGAIAVAGDSAGGGLAMAALIAARDAGGPLPAALVCLSPWVDLDRRSVPLAREPSDPVLTANDLERFRDWYVVR